MRLRPVCSIAILVAAVSHPASADEFVLHVDGGCPSFTADYRLTRGDGAVVAGSETAACPGSLRLDGRGLVVRVRSDGDARSRLDAELLRDGRRVGQGNASGSGGHVTLSAGQAPGWNRGAAGYGGWR